VIGAFLLLQVFSAETRRVTNSRLTAWMLVLAGVFMLLLDAVGVLAILVGLMWLAASLLRSYASAAFRTGR